MKFEFNMNEKFKRFGKEVFEGIIAFIIILLLLIGCKLFLKDEEPESNTFPHLIF
jgi:hypothetical protein